MTPTAAPPPIASFRFREALLSSCVDARPSQTTATTSTAEERLVQRHVSPPQTRDGCRSSACRSALGIVAKNRRTDKNGSELKPQEGRREENTPPPPQLHRSFRSGRRRRRRGKKIRRVQLPARVFPREASTFHTLLVVSGVDACALLLQAPVRPMRRSLPCLCGARATQRGRVEREGLSNLTLWPFFNKATSRASKYLYREKKPVGLKIETMRSFILSYEYAPPQMFWFSLPPFLYAASQAENPTRK